MSLLIRSADAEDADALAAIYDHYVRTSLSTFEEDAVGPLVMAGRIAAISESYPWLVAVDGDRVLGYAYANRLRERIAYRWAVESTIYLHADACGRGIGRRLYDILMTCLADQKLTLAMAAIALPNPASVALHERCGFRSSGLWPAAGRKHGRWIDVGWYACELVPRRDDMPDPRLPDPVLIARRCAEA